MPFNFITLSIPDAILIEPKKFGDERGFFIETYKYSDFAKAGISEYFVQDNYAKSRKGVLRGLHYQREPNAQGKLVQSIKGSIFDVIVDIRNGSNFYGQWVGAELSSEDGNMIYIPPGFAHGYLVLSEYAEVMYKCTKEYLPQDERGIIWNDPDINIKWQISEPILSEKDKMLPRLKFADNNFEYNL